MSKNLTAEDIQNIAKNSIGHTFGELSSHKKSDEEFDKGSFGHIMETDVYDYDINSLSEADFPDAGIELKVTPYKINKNKTLSAKERLVLNIINYMEEYKNDFYHSHLYEKNKCIQILWYLHEDGKDKNDFFITHQLLYSFPEEDLPTIIEDYNIIIQKIKDGKAHEISESDTTYLGACTKGANANSLREQPFSPILAKQRAFCLKTSYMTQLVRNYIGSVDNVEKIITQKGYSFLETIKNTTDTFVGMSILELKEKFGIVNDSKNLNSILISKMFGLKGKINNADEFKKANIIPKTCRVEKTGRIIESISFPAFSFIDVANTSFDDSLLKSQLEEFKLLFFVFEEENNDYIFKGFKLFYVPEKIINSEFRDIYNKTQNVIKTGNIIKHIDENGRRLTNFPGMSNSKYGHVRPHGRNSEDTYPLPIPENMFGAKEYTKQCFWINNSYVYENIKDLLK